MRKRAVVSLMLFAALGLSANADDWKLVFSDDFERAEAGPDWVTLHGRPLKIAGGRMQISEHDMDIAIVNKAFEGDLRIEFDAQATPGVPPCDISPMLYGNTFWGYGPGYHIAFGGASNTRAMIRGSGAHADYKGPEAIIDPAKVYHVMAERDGAEVRLFVDGKLLLKAATKEHVGGPGMDRVGITTWTSCIVDNVKVWSKPPTVPVKVVTKLPPALVKGGLIWGNDLIESSKSELTYLHPGLDFYRKGDYEKAIEVFSTHAAKFDGALALAYTVGHGEFLESDKDIAAVAAAFAALAKKNPDDKIIRDYAFAAAQFARVKSDDHATIRLLEMGPDNNPFYWKAMYYEAKRTYWDGKEGGSQRHFRRAAEMFRQLKEKFPKNDLVRNYLGEKTEWGEEFKTHPEGTPAWAASLHEAYGRQAYILEWWFKNRQAPDGQLGGGWGDDCELFRSWGPVAVVSTGCPAVMGGIDKLTDGIWRFCGKLGYEPGLGDVEHSAEPTADTEPPMLLLHYGDPMYYERNLRSAKTITEIYSAPDARGYPRFKSCFLGGEEWGKAPLEQGDTPYHLRVAKALIWLAWAGNAEARDWIVRYADGWRDAIMREEGGKPAGVPPGALFFPSGGITPPAGAAWWSSEDGCYGWPGFTRLTGDLQLNGYAFSGDRKFLDAYDRMMEFGEEGPIRKVSLDHGEKSSPDWIVRALQEFPDAQSVALRRWLTGERVYDGYLRKLGHGFQQYLATHDLGAYEKHLAHVAEGLRDNFAMRTSEVVYTDRAGMAAADDVLGAYCGGVRLWIDDGPPTVAATWVAPDTNFAALVTDDSTERFRAWVYNLHDRPVRYGLRLWRLAPGRYTVAQGEKLPGERDDVGQYRIAHVDAEGRPTAYARVEHAHRHRGDILWLDVPPRKTWVVDLRLAERDRAAGGDPAIPGWWGLPGPAPDFAIHARDLKAEGGKLKVTVHNIGNAAGACEVRLEVGGASGPDARSPESSWKEISRRPLDSLPPPTHFMPSTAEVVFDLPAGAGLCRVTLDPSDQVRELNELNNEAEVAAR